MERINELLLYWFIFVGTGAMVGGFLGSLLADGTKALYRKLNKWIDK